MLATGGRCAARRRWRRAAPRAACCVGAAAACDGGRQQQAPKTHPQNPITPHRTKKPQPNRGNECGPDQHANIITVANLLQEVGGNHGVALWGRADSGFASMPGMDHLIFVATRIQIRMEAYPKWCAESSGVLS